MAKIPVRSMLQVATPVEAEDAANKGYVDQEINDHTHGDSADGGWAAGVVPSDSTMPVITHPLATQDLAVFIREVATGQLVDVAAETVDGTGTLSDNHVRLTFDVQPTPGQFRYLLLSSAPTSVGGTGGEHTHAQVEVSGLVEALDTAVTDAELTIALSGKADAAHNHAVSWQTITSATSLTLDASTGSMFRGDISTDTTLNPPTGGTDPQRLMVRLAASGADRSVSLSGSIIKVTEKSFPMTVPLNKKLFLGLLLDGSTWYLLAAGLEP